MFDLFPFTNFHDLNMDWIIKSIKTLWSKAVFTVNNTMPDENGNVNLPTVAGVSSVNGIGPNGQGNVEISTQSTSSLLPLTDIVAESGVTNDYTRVIKRDVGIISVVARFTTTESTSGGDPVLRGFPTPASGIPMYFVGVNLETNIPARFFINSYGELAPVSTTQSGQYEISGCYISGTTEKIPIVQT